jgi:hypothetical protein
MEIHIGTYPTADEGRFAHFWITPNRPCFRMGQVRDHGFLNVALIDINRTPLGEPTTGIEPMSESRVRLQDLVGGEACTKAWADYMAYGRQPFCAVFDHPQYGRLYFAPDALGSTDSKADLRYSTRVSDPALDAGGVLHAHRADDQLKALLLYGNMSSISSLVPDGWDLWESMERARVATEKIMQSHKEFLALVDWTFEERLQARVAAASGRFSPEPDHTLSGKYESCAQYMWRPPALKLEPGTAEFHKWFDESGPRLEPLNRDQLEMVLLVSGLSPKDARDQAEYLSLTPQDHEWYRQQRLGKLAPAVDALHCLIEAEGAVEVANTEWLERARAAADFCTNSLASDPRAIFDALQDVAEQRFQHAMGERGATIASAAMQYILDPSGASLDVDADNPATRWLEAQSGYAAASSLAEVERQIAAEHTLEP